MNAPHISVQRVDRQGDRGGWRLGGRLAAGLFALVAGGTACGGTTDMAPSGPRQEFTPPPAGSYRLEVIQQAPHGRVDDLDGRGYPLDRYTTGQITLLSFVYTYCVDPSGCPLAFDTFRAVRERLLAAPGLARQVRFVSLSFDPTNDTPAAMKAYAGALADRQSPLRWHFLTTRSVRELKPIVDGFGQDVSVQLDERGRPTRLFNHTLKIFLLDSRARVREIYSTAFLLPDIIFNDIQTLLLERAAIDPGS